MESHNIKISVIMPVYNSGEYLKTAVDSILGQSFRDIELILVDDGSTDGSSEHCDEYARKDDRVKVIHQKNRGICNARNAALKIAKGEYIGFSDHDDEYLPGFLENAYKEAVANNADLVKVGKKEFIIKDGIVLRTKFSKLPYKIYSRKDIQSTYFKLVDSDELDCLWDGLFKRSVIEKYNIRLDEHFRNGGEDIDFIQRFISKINTFVTIDTIYYNHYIRKGFSTSAKFNTEKIEAKKRIIVEMQKTIKSLEIDINNHQFDYTYLLLRQYIAPLCSLYSNKSYNLSNVEKKGMIKAIKSEDFYYEFCNKQSVRKIMSVSKKYALLYFLFKFGFYGLILTLYRERSKTT